MLQVSEVMDSVRGLLNDTEQAVYTNTVQLPYLNIALRELEEVMEENNIGSTNGTREGISLPAGQTELVIGPSTTLNLPLDLIEIRQAYERTVGDSMSYSEIQRVEFLPAFNSDERWQFQIYWKWQDQKMQFLGSTTDEQIKIEYIKRRVPKIVDPVQSIDIIGAQTFLEYRTAALVAEYVMENETRAATLNGNTQLSLDRFLSINTKGRQAIITRRRPFRAAYKMTQRVG